jgi:hypothetical protein
LKRTQVHAGFLILVLSLACGPSTPKDEAFLSLLQAESDFAATTGEHGMKVAFLRYLHDDSILFRPHPVDGKSFVSRGEDPEIDLSWVASDAGLAGSEDLGWTTGPFHVAAVPEEQLPPTDGFFVSIWRRLPNQRWKVRVDLGVVTPAECIPEGSIPPPAWIPPGSAPSADSSKLEKLEQEFSRLATRDGIEQAYKQFLGEGGHIYRDGRCPLNAAQAAEDSPSSWNADEIVLADSSDLGFVRGSYLSPAGDHGYYVRIWRLIDAQWRIAVDITSPLPADVTAE